MSTTPEETLDRILGKLRSDDPNRRLSAIQELGAHNFSSPAILLELERLALKDTNKEIHQAALHVLDSAAHRQIRARTTTLEPGERSGILREINIWEKQGLIDPAQAAVIKTRYNFDAPPPPAQPQAVPSPLTQPPPAPTPPHPDLKPEPTPASPRPSLTQTLLSETSIKIALYLGAFFVIAAALILAALVEAARLPILIAGTLVFGSVALAIRNRLPQPSFALFIVFSFLLPITANVVEEFIGLEGGVNSIYWIFVSLAMAAVWIFSTWLYESRLFCLTAFLALDSAFYNIGDFLGELSEAQPEFYIPVFSIAALIGLVGVRVLKSWKNSRFAAPLFAVDQIQLIGTLFSASIFASIRASESEPIGLYWLTYVLVFGLAAFIYVWSNALYKFVLFPWLAAAALIPISWLAIQTFDPGSTLNIAALAFWAVILSLVSEAAFRFERTRTYSLPLLLASAPLFFAASIWGFAEDVWYGFTCLLITFIVYSVLHILRPRGWLWAASLIAGSLAYFTFFGLPFMENVEVFFGVQLLVLSLVFLLPDLFLKTDFKDNPNWRWPPRLFGALFAFLNLFLLIGDEEPLKSALLYFVYALFFAIYALRYRRAWIGYIGTISAALGLIFLLDHFDLDLGLPALSALAVIYFGAGVLLLPRKDWSGMLRISGLTLGSLVVLWAFVLWKDTGGWYALAIGSLFAVELFLNRNGLLEIAMPFFYNIGALMLLRDFQIEETAYFLLAAALIWLGADLLLEQTIKGTRPLRWLTRGLGGMLAGFTTFYLLLPDLNSSRVIWICFSILTVFFAVYAWFYRLPKLGYVPAAYLPLTIFYLLRDFDGSKWLFPMIAIAVLYYTSGYLLRRTQRGQGWERTLLFSGLGLGTIASFSAPSQGGLDTSIPVTLAATLWAVEAFARRNVWLGFPANALYLMAYFMILVELKVDEPQYFSMGAALLGVIMHHLLTSAGSKTGAFLTGMVSQLILLGTTYVQMLSTERLMFFVVLFFQSLAVLVYGIVIRSRSLVFTPILFAVLGVVTVIYSALKGISTVVLIGCTGLLLLMLGILAVVMRERITKLGERLSDWQA